MDLHTRRDHFQERHIDPFRNVFVFFSFVILLHTLGARVCEYDVMNDFLSMHYKRVINVMAPHYSCHFTRCSLLFVEQAQWQQCQIKISHAVCVLQSSSECFHSIFKPVPLPIISLCAQLLFIVTFSPVFLLGIAIVILSLIRNHSYYSKCHDVNVQQKKIGSNTNKKIQKISIVIRKHETPSFLSLRHRSRHFRVRFFVYRALCWHIGQHLLNRYL